MIYIYILTPTMINFILLSNYGNGVCVQTKTAYQLFDHHTAHRQYYQIFRI